MCLIVSLCLKSLGGLVGCPLLLAGQFVNIKTDYISIAGKLQGGGFRFGRFNLLVRGLGLYLETGRVLAPTLINAVN